MRDWVRMTSLMTSLRCSSGMSRVASTSRLVRIAVSGVRSSCDGHRREVARRRQRRLRAVLLVPDALQHALDGLGDLDGLGRAAHLDVGGFVAGIDLPGLLCEPLQRPHRERGKQPTGKAAAPIANEQMTRHAAMQVVGVGDGGVIGRPDGHRHRFAARESRRCAPGSAPRRRRCRRSRRAVAAERRWRSTSPASPLRTVMTASWSLGDFGISSSPRGRNGIAKPAASSSRRSRRSLRSLVMPIQTMVPTMPTDDRRGDGRRERHPGPQRRGAA